MFKKPWVWFKQAFGYAFFNVTHIWAKVECPLHIYSPMQQIESFGYGTCKSIK
jgi:hypothetical protein